MRMAAVALAVVFLLILTPAPSAGDANAPELSFHPPAEAGAAFRQFFAEYEGMVKSWWGHGGQRASRGRWHVTGLEVTPKGARQPHFIVTVAVEQEGFTLALILTFEVPPHAQASLFRASHAAYDATLGAVLGQFSGHRRWDGGGPKETARAGSTPIAQAIGAFFFPGRLLRYRQSQITYANKLKHMMDTHQKVTAAAVLLIAGLAGGFWLGRAALRDGLAGTAVLTPSPRPMPGAALSLTPGTVPTGANAIAVSDQAPGLSVAVGMVALGQNGWVVIHEAEEGKPGRILGAKRFDAGSGTSGSVELLRPTEEGKVYFAMLHTDDSDRQFDHTKDLPIKDPAGNVILMRFVTAAEARAE